MLTRKFSFLDLPLIYTQTDLAHAEARSLAGGAAVVYTHRSPFKETVNEDSVALIPVDEQSAVLVVADGLGGLPAGAEASQRAVAAVTAAVERTQTQSMALRDAVLNGIERANADILAAGSGSATTIAVVEIQGLQIRSYHVGDSLALVSGQRGRLKFQTVPHSPVGYAVEAGLLDEAEAVHHAQRNIVSNVIGSPEMRIDIGPTITLSACDTLVLASDGLPDNLYISELVECVRAGPLRRAASRLISICQDRMRHARTGMPSHPDDMSFIIYRPGAR